MEEGKTASLPIYEIILLEKLSVYQCILLHKFRVKREREGRVNNLDIGYKLCEMGDVLRFKYKQRY